VGRTRRSKASWPKVVLDASVLVSSAFGGVPAAAVREAERCQLLVSAPLLNELERLTAKLRGKLTSAQVEDLERALRRLRNLAELVEIRGKLALCRDPEDDAYLETCQVGRAHFLVTGDPDLLEIEPAVLKRHRLGRLAIVTPADFLRARKE
jgi:putative PIN family toxin of toxin-antitoxin system